MGGPDVESKNFDSCYIYIITSLRKTVEKSVTDDIYAYNTP